MRFSRFVVASMAARGCVDLENLTVGMTEQLDEDPRLKDRSSRAGSCVRACREWEPPQLITPAGGHEETVSVTKTFDRGCFTARGESATIDPRNRCLEHSMRCSNTTPRP